MAGVTTTKKRFPIESGMTVPKADGECKKKKAGRTPSSVPPYIKGREINF
jgi:hypothetical protein